MDSQSPLDQETQKASDPHIYKPDEGEDDEDEIDRRIRRADERLRRLTIVGAPEFNNDFLCEDTLTVEGGYDTGYAVNYVDCGAAAANQSVPVVSTCPPSNPCTLDFHFIAPDPGGFSTSQTGLDMYVGDCQFTPGAGWHANHWGVGCIDADCFNNNNSVCNDLSEACKCGWRARWVDVSGASVQISLAFVQGDDLVTPDGWWLLVGVASLFCFWGGCQFSIPYYGAWLGSDDSIFTTDLALSLSLPPDVSNPGDCSPDPLDFNITFHPC